MRIYKSSSGNSKRLFQQIPRRKKPLLGLKSKITDEEIITKRLNSNKDCCANGIHFLGCLGRKFLDHAGDSGITNMSKLMEYIKKCRELTRCKDKQELRVFVSKLYDRALVVDDQGRTKSMNYRLPIFDDFVTYVSADTNKVCRKGISTAYGFSVKLMQMCSATKRKGTRQQFIDSTKSFTDATIHSNSFAETAKVFRENLVDVNFVGKLNFAIYFQQYSAWNIVSSQRILSFLYSEKGVFDERIYAYSLHLNESFCRK